MKTKIITIGNSQGIRIPKPLLEISGIKSTVKLIVKKNEIKIIPVLPETTSNTTDSMIMSEPVLGRDWNREQEDRVWQNL